MTTPTKERVDYVKLALDYDVRVEDDANRCMALRQAWTKVSEIISKFPGGHSSGTIYPKYGSQYFIEVYGPQADWLVRHGVYQLPGWRYLKVQRIDWRSEREQAIDPLLLTLAAEQQGKRSVVYQNTPVRSKKNDRDRGGRSSRSGSRSSAMSAIVYVIKGEKPAFEVNFRDEPAQEVWAWAAGRYAATLAETGGQIETAEYAFYAALMDRMELGAAKFALKSWGFQVTDWREGKEMAAVVKAGFNPAELAVQLLDLSGVQQQQMVFESLYAKQDEMYGPPKDE